MHELQHSYKGVECIVNEFLNNYWRKDPQEVPAQQEQFENTYYYMLVLQTTKRTLERLGFFLKSNQRIGMWLTRRATTPCTR
eukprot:694566-Amphidinium_carterae.1